MEPEDFYKVWTVEQYNKQPRGEGWLIMGASHHEEEGPPCAAEASDAAFEWAKRHLGGVSGPDEAQVVVVDDLGKETRWLVQRRVEIRIDVEEEE
jgi:hypothetical protein